MFSLLMSAYLILEQIYKIQTILKHSATVATLLQVASELC